MCVTCFVHMIKRLNDTFIRACYWLTVTLYSAIKCFDWLKLRLVFIIIIIVVVVVIVVIVMWLVCLDASGDLMVTHFSTGNSTQIKIFTIFESHKHLKYSIKRKLLSTVS